MDAIKDLARPRAEPISVFLRACVVLLALTTAAIHASLGGLLFTINAIGYGALAAAMILPAIGPARWLVRLTLLGFTAATIGGWVLFGARFPLAYVDKGLEVALIVFLALELCLFDGGPTGVVRRMRDLLVRVLAIVFVRGAR